jgi:hypothetical protein
VSVVHLALEERVAYKQDAITVAQLERFGCRGAGIKKDRGE